MATPIEATIGAITVFRTVRRRAWIDERIAIVRWSCVTAIDGTRCRRGSRQAPADATPPPAVCTRRGPLHRMFHHTAHTLQDKFIGYPDDIHRTAAWATTSHEQFAVQVAKADTHRFTLYRSDFLPGTNLFSPSGASRFNIMFARFPSWLGPISVEWTPDQPAAGASRAARRSWTRCSRRASRSLAERVVIAPSPYPGAMGTEAVEQFYKHDLPRPGRRRRRSRCRRPRRPPREFIEMKHPSIDRAGSAARNARRMRARGRS